MTVGIQDYIHFFGPLLYFKCKIANKIDTFRYICSTVVYPEGAYTS